MKNIPKLPYIDKEDPWSSHSIIAKWLKRLPEKSIILDIGTASGTIGRSCDEFGFVRKGIEPNPAWAELAKPYYEYLSICAIEEADDEFIQGADGVIIADVLEHLSEPEITLMRVANLQRPDCLIMISVPNVANIWIRLNLLFGKFEYSDRGILDRTHLRFFTRASLIRLLNQSNLDIIEFRSTPIPLAILYSFFITNPFGRFIHKVLAKCTHLFPSLLGYQFVVLVRRMEIRENLNGNN